MRAWSRRSANRAATRKRAASRPLSVGFHTLEPRALMAADSANVLHTYDAAAVDVAPAWFEQLSQSTASALSQGLFTTQQAVETTQWKGASVDRYMDEWIVQLNNQALQQYQSVSQATALFSNAGLNFEVLGGLGLEGQLLVRSSGASEASVADWFKSNSSIAYYEPNAILPLSRTPNDPNYSQLWGLNNTGQTVGGVAGTPGADISAPEAWNITTGSSNVVVAVIDTGIDFTHPDLQANMWTNPGEVGGNGGDDDHNGFVDDLHGYDFVNNRGYVTDDNGHGTHVAGTIGATGDNGTGVAGVNWNVSLMALKFLDASGSGSLSNAVRAINYVTMMRQQFGINVRVANNSWGGGGYDQSLHDAIAAAGQAGILFVAAAGNSGANNDASPNYPSNYNLDNVIAVAATDNRDSLASFSNYGATTVDIAAPGVSIYSTAPGGGYQTMSGTSMATPHVTGVAALAFAVDPNATVAQVRSALLDGVDHIASLSGKVASGGRLNARGTLDLLGMTVVGSSPAAGSTLSSPLTSFTVDFSQNVDPATIQASDFTVNGMAASSYTLVDANTITFRFGSSPMTVFGPQTMGIAEGAIGRSGGGIAVRGWQSTFYYDQAPLGVVAATPSEGQSLTAAPTSITLQFSEAIAAASVGLDDLTLSAGTVTQAQLLTPTSVRYTLSLPTANGTFTYTLGTGALTDLAGNPGTAYTGHFSVSDPAVIRYQSSGAPLAIPDLGTATSSITISDSRTIRDVDVEVNITHTWDNDLNLYLIAPNGTRIKLAADVGGSGRNFTGAIFDDSAATSITNGSAPFTGRFRPQGSLAPLSGLNTAGTWKLEVTDDYQWDTGTIDSWALQFRANQPPTIGAIADQTMAHRAGSLSVPITVSDPEGSAVTVSSQVVDLACDLRQRLGLNVYQGLLDINYNLNFRGAQEKYIRGSEGNWYYIVPDGGLYHWNGTIAASTREATLATRYYTDPSLLWNAQPSSNSPAQSTYDAQNHAVVVTTSADYCGDLSVRVTASDGTDSSSSYFTVHVVNQAPVLASVPDQTMSHTADKLEVSLSVTNPDGDPLTYGVSASALASNPAYDLRQQLGLNVYQQLLDINYNLNFRGAQEKYIRGTAGNWYYIVPDGTLYHWNGSIAASTPVASLNSTYWADPSKLWNAQATETAVMATVDAAGKVTIDPPAGFTGDIRVTATVSDGVVTDTKSFMVHVVNQPPVLAAIPDQTMSHTADKLEVTLGVTNPDGDPLTYGVSASALASNPAYDLRQQLGLNVYQTLLDINYNLNLRGAQEKYIRGTAGNWYYIVPDGTLYHWNNSIAASTPVATLDTTYWADPSKLWNATQSASSTVQATVDAAGKVTIDPPAGFTGDIRVTATVSDGASTATQAFTVHVVNQPPVLATVADQTISQSTASVLVALNVTNLDGDPLTYGVTASALANNPAYDLRQQLGLNVYQTLLDINYNLNLRGAQEKYIRGTAGNWYYIVPDGTLYHWNGSIAASTPVANLNSTYWADPSKLWNAQATETPVTATVDAAGKVTVTRPAGFTGDIRVTATVSDGASTATQAFTIHVAAAASAAQSPVLAAATVSTLEVRPEVAAFETDSAQSPQVADRSYAMSMAMLGAAHESTVGGGMDVSLSRIATALGDATTQTVGLRPADATTTDQRDTTWLSPTSGLHAVKEELASPAGFGGLALGHWEAEGEFHSLADKVLTDLDTIETLLLSLVAHDASDLAPALAH